MRTLLIFSGFFLITLTCKAQSLKKYSIGDSGCSAYLFCDPGIFEKTYSEDSSLVYTGDCKADSLTYGIICAKIKDVISNADDAESLLVNYLGYLKSAFEIKSSAGYGKGHTMNNKPDARGIIDYWKDKDGKEWKIKGWTDGKFIAVMYLYANGKLNETEKMNLFLNGFRFPGM